MTLLTNFIPVLRTAIFVAEAVLKFLVTIAGRSMVLA